jgi:hypothetical protein
MMLRIGFTINRSRNLLKWRSKWIKWNLDELSMMSFKDCSNEVHISIEIYATKKTLLDQLLIIDVILIKYNLGSNGNIYVFCKL